MNEPEASVDDPTESQLADLVRAAASVAAPEATRAAIAGADRPDAGPRPGELWRAQPPGGGPVTLVWVRQPDGSGLVVVPVTLDVEQADDGALVVPANLSPLGLPLAVHLVLETLVDPAAFVDRVGFLEVPDSVVEAVSAALERTAGGPLPTGLGPFSVGPRLTSELDERLEYRHALKDQVDVLAVGQYRPITTDPDGPVGEWWPLDTPSDRAELVKAIHRVLAETHPGARIAPRPAGAAGTEHLSAVALVAELDAFVLVTVVEGDLDEAGRLEAAREALHTDQLLNAVCLAEPGAPFLAVVVDRRDVVAAIETPSGRLAPPRQSRPPAAVGAALTKFLDATISPFGRLVSTYVEGHAPDPRSLAVDVSADAVRTIEGSARSFKTEGKRPGYERVKRHQAAITRLVEQALNSPDVDVAALLEDQPPEGRS